MHRQQRDDGGHVRLFSPSRVSAIGLTALLILSTAIAVALRYGVIENAALGLGCDAEGGILLCRLRQGLIWTFNHNVFGTFAIVSAVFNLVRPSIALTALAIVLTAFGLALYNTAAAALSCGLILLVLARPDYAPQASAKG